MSDITPIQWCDSTVNPVMGCAGCEIFQAGGELVEKIDDALSAISEDWNPGDARSLFSKLIRSHYKTIRKPQAFQAGVTNTNIWHVRQEFLTEVKAQLGAPAKRTAETIIRHATSCYAARLHLNKGLSIVNPKRKINKGYAPIFNKVTLYENRLEDMAAKRDLLGTTHPNFSWKDKLPRLIFVSDMGDAFSNRSARTFDHLREHAIKPITSAKGRRHLWLWLTKRPDIMADFAEEISGFPENVCVMTTLTTANAECLQRLTDLKGVKAHCRGLSLEPIWERIPPSKLNLSGIDWVIVGGESGARGFTRDFDLAWARELRDHCRRHKVAFFLKQLGRSPVDKGKPVTLKDSHGGNWNEWPDTKLKVRQFPKYFHDYRRNEIPMHAGRRPSPKREDVENSNRLSPEERTRFKALDKEVGKAAKTFVDAALALQEIKVSKLYREKYDTYEDYCLSVHQISRSYAHRLVQAGKIAAELLPIGNTTDLPQPQNEAQCRELGRIKDPEVRRDIWTTIVRNTPEDQLTARAVSKAVGTRLSEKPTLPRKPKKHTPTERLAKASELLDQIIELYNHDQDCSMLLNRMQKLLG